MGEVSFAEFYRSVHGYAPFPWQERLASRAAAGDWPEAIAVPTGCGKTSVIDVAVYALAAQAGSAQRNAAMRIFFVVDRRLVVDDAYAHAVKLAKALESGAAEWVGQQLWRFGGARPLEVAIMRGGMYRSDSWADVPNQPLVCVSTVDQVGSRLLFRGYGVSESRRPVHAGLVGNDSLLILDEAHLSQPFLETLVWVKRYQSAGWREVSAVQGLQCVRMSATVDGGFGLDAADQECEALRSRLHAKKLAELKEAPNVAEAVAEEARKLAKAGARVVGVVLNTVGAARAAFEALEGNKVLLTGRVRPFDRDQLLAEYLPRMCAKRKREDSGQLYVVATQTVEVGADLDFDGLVTEAAPLDALRQRFGRLDRLGELQSTKAVILKAKRSASEWLYGEPLEKTWEWLKGQAPPVDFGVEAITGAPAELNTRREAAPLMFPAHVDAWAQTNPAPSADPEVAPFLHGAGAVEAADVQIVWRADLPENPQTWTEILEAVPPVSTEALQLPLGAAMRWLRGKTAPVTDVEGAAPPREEDRAPARRTFVVWRGPERGETRARAWPRAGDTIVVRSSEGGCDRYGWNPDAKEPVEDIGDLCANRRAEQGGGRFRLRVHPKVWRPVAGETPEDIEALLQRVQADDEEAIERLGDLIGARIGGEWMWWNYGAGHAILAESQKRKRRSTTDTDDGDEDDSSSFRMTTSRKPVLLETHMSAVAEKAKGFLEGCGLAGEFARSVERAAQFHDLGKWDTRFQLKLGNTNAEPVAKGDGRRRRDTEYPKGARHEFASVALAELGVDWPEQCDRELALYLIGTHHGWGRPFPPVWTDTDYEIKAEVNGRAAAIRNPSTAARIDSGWAGRFWRLNRKYGWWGLAYLEAMVRRADCVRSREEEEA
jgi:CRISPR-associated endonuclease/helicase Cas3